MPQQAELLDFRFPLTRRARHGTRPPILDGTLGTGAVLVPASRSAGQFTPGEARAEAWRR